MAELSMLISEYDANIRTVRHERAVADLDVGEAYRVFRIETSGAGRSASITESIKNRGYTVEIVNAR